MTFKISNHASMRKKRVSSRKERFMDSLGFDVFLELLRGKTYAGEICFRFSDEDETTERFIGSSDINGLYWAGLCDAPGCEFKTADVLLGAKIYGGRSLKERWDDVVIREIDAIRLDEWLEFRKNILENMKK